MKLVLLAVLFIGTAVVASPINNEPVVVASPVDTEPVVVASPVDTEPVVVASPVDTEAVVVASPVDTEPVAVADPADPGKGAVPYDVNDAAADDGGVGTQVIESADVDVTQLLNDLSRLHQSASDVIYQVEATLSTLHSLVPHTIRKRQTSIDGSISKGPGGPTGRIDVNHTRGGTTYNGNISRGPGGTNWGAGVSHSSGNSNWGVNYQRGLGGSSFGGSYQRTWNKGRTSLGISGSRGSGGGSSAMITFKHSF